MHVASIDHTRGRRSLRDLQRRGNWINPKSVRRYEKAGRLSEQLLRLPALVRKRALVCAEQIGVTMIGRSQF